MTGRADEFWFGGKTVIVTGGNGGIGQGIVEAFSERDANVAIVDIGAALVPQQTRGKGRIVDIRTDITDRSAVEAMVKQVVDAFGRIDVLVNNAGRGEGLAELLDITDEMIDWMTDLNIRGTVNVSRAVGAVMVRQGSGSIINISSAAALSGRSGRLDPFYAGCKGFINSFSKATAAGLGPKGVRVNTVSPGFIVPEHSDAVSDHSFWTTMVDKFGTPDTYNANYADQGVHVVDKGAQQFRGVVDQPLQRLGRPRDIAAAVVYFASDAARHATGQILSIDGGGYMPS